VKSQKHWLLPNRVLYWKLTGDVSINNFRDILLEINGILQNSGEKIHVILDACTAHSLSGDDKDMQKIVRRVANHARMGILMVATHSFTLKQHFNRVTVAFGTHLRYTTNYKNAWQSLRNIDNSLPYGAPEKPTTHKRRQQHHA